MVLLAQERGYHLRQLRSLKLLEITVMLLIRWNQIKKFRKIVRMQGVQAAPAVPAEDCKKQAACLFLIGKQEKADMAKEKCKIKIGRKGLTNPRKLHRLYKEAGDISVSV